MFLKTLNLHFIIGKLPAGTRCSFESGWCGWKNTEDKNITLKWRLNRGMSKNKYSGPSSDNTFANDTGKRLCHADKIIYHPCSMYSTYCHKFLFFYPTIG